MHSKHLIKLLGLSVLAIVGVMAVTASAAQAAKWLILLNGAHVKSITLSLQALAGYMKAENGLKVACTGGSGSVTGTENAAPSGDGNATNSIKGSASITFEGCDWVGSESTCTINDGGEGNINAAGEGEAIMNGAGETFVSASNKEFTTIITEGVFCTIPEEEEVSGGAHVKVLEAATATKVKLGHIAPLNLKLGNSNVTELVGEVHATDAANPNATFALELV